jgi:hypothetical protein
MEINAKYIDSESFQKVQKCFKYSKDAFELATIDSEEAARYAFTNIQWSDEAIENAENFKKPYLTYNLILPIINTLKGVEQTNRRRARFKPRNMQSVKIADIIQDRYNALNDEQNIEELLQIAFVDALVTKLGGWIERTFEMNDEGFLEYKYKSCNQFRIYPDPELLASDCSLEHCNWVIKESFERLETIEETYGVTLPVEESEREGFWWSLINTFKRFTDKSYTGNSENMDKVNDKYRILEMLERVNVPVKIAWDGEKIQHLTKKEYEDAKSNGANLQHIMDSSEKRIMITTIVPNFVDAVIYKKEISNPSNNFGLFNVFSFRFNSQALETTSLVDLLIDPQDDINKGKSQYRDYVSQVLAGLIAISGREEEAVKLIQEKGNQPNLVVNLRSPNSSIQKIGPQNISPEILNNVESSVGFSERTSMVTQTVKGQTERSGESGILFEKKLEVASAAINPYFKSLSLTRKEIARDYVQNIGYVYGEKDRPIKLKTNKGKDYQEIVNLEMNGQVYNDVRNPEVYVELDEGEDNQTAKEDNFNQILALSNVIAQINPAFVHVKTLLQSAPVNGMEDWIAHIDSIEQMQSEQSAEAGDMEKTKQTLENMKIQKGMLLNEEKLRLEAAKALADAENKSKGNMPDKKGAANVRRS